MKYSPVELWYYPSRYGITLNQWLPYVAVFVTEYMDRSQTNTSLHGYGLQAPPLQNREKTCIPEGVVKSKRDNVDKTLSPRTSTQRYPINDGGDDAGG